MIYDDYLVFIFLFMSCSFYFLSSSHTGQVLRYWSRYESLWVLHVTLRVKKWKKAAFVKTADMRRSPVLSLNKAQIVFSKPLLRGEGSPPCWKPAWVDRPLLQMQPGLTRITHTPTPSYAVISAGRSSVPCSHRKLLNELISAVIYVNKRLECFIELYLSVETVIMGYRHKLRWYNQTVGLTV